jgi:hypothetical protein
MPAFKINKEFLSEVERGHKARAYRLKRGPPFVPLCGGFVRVSNGQHQ